MTDFDVNIKRLLKESESGDVKTEIWAEIINKETCSTTNERIWWEEDDGTIHDETPNLPIELRNKIDNAWLEKKGKW